MAEQLDDIEFDPEDYSKACPFKKGTNVCTANAEMLYSKMEEYKKGYEKAKKILAKGAGADPKELANLQKQLDDERASSSDKDKEL